MQGIDGDSNISGFEKQIEIVSFSHGVTQPVSASGSGRGSLTVAQCEHQAFILQTQMSNHSPKVMLHASNGQAIPKVEVTLCRAAGDKPIEYVKYEFEDVVISSYHPAGSGTGDDVPMESIGLTYGKVKMTYTASDSTGKAQGKMTASYDRRTGKAE
jgi:type VI secretion system secreted protein Hcp